MSHNRSNRTESSAVTHTHGNQNLRSVGRVHPPSTSACGGPGSSSSRCCWWCTFGSLQNPLLFLPSFFLLHFFLVLLYFLLLLVPFLAALRGRRPASLAPVRRREQLPLGLAAAASHTVDASREKLRNLRLLHHRVCLDESFPMGPCSTSGGENSLRYGLGPHQCDCHVSTQ